MVKYIDLGKSKNIKLCIAGNPTLHSIIKKYVDKKPNNKISKVKSFKKANKEILSCDFLYASSSEPDLAMKSISMASNAKNKIATISDVTDFANNKNGLIHIFEDKGRIKFGLNLKKAKSELIKINSKLIESASKLY